VVLAPEELEEALDRGLAGAALFCYQRKTCGSSDRRVKPGSPMSRASVPRCLAFEVGLCFGLPQEHGPERVRAACARGVRQHAIGAEHIMLLLT
jgi:hypothetical protein